MSKNDKDKEKFEKKISSILSSSASAKAWSNLLPITKELFQLLNKNTDDFNFSKLSNKLFLAKRLAQCLNPEYPGSVHEEVLDIYFVILRNIAFFNETCLMDNLGIFASGLFPFFPNASLNNKLKFIEKIIYGCFMSISSEEVILCLPGLLTSLIQGLDDNNDITKGKIYLIFDDLSRKVGERNFYGNYWTLILRNKLLRSSGMKYLLEKIVKYSDYQKMSQEKKLETISNEFPNINTVVVNALCQVIEEKEIITVRTGMDFIITRLPLTKENNMLNDEAKITLIISSLKLLIKNENSTIKRLKNLILGANSLDEEINFETDDMNYKINLVIQAFLKIFNPDILYPQDILKNNIKLIEQFSEQLIEFTNLIFPKVFFNLLVCVVHFWQIELNSSEKAHQDEIIAKFTSFLEKDSIYMEWLWNSIANNLKNLVENDLKDTDNYDDLDTKEKSFEYIINDALQPLKFSLLFLDIQPLEKRIKNYLPIITHLLNLMKKFIINNRDSLEKLRQILLTTLVLIKDLQEKTVQNKESNNLSSSIPSSTSSFSSTNSSINNDNKNIDNDEMNISRQTIFLEIEEEIKSNDIFNITEEASLEAILLNKQNKVLIDSLTEAIINYQKFYIDILNKYLEMNKDAQLTKNEITIFRQSTEIMIRLQEYSQQTEIPEWISYLEKIIFDPNVNIKLSLEASNYLLDMNMSTFNHHDIYNKIKNDFENKEIDSSIIDKEYLEYLISKTGVQKNCHELLMGKFYLVLSNQSFQKSIMDLLIKVANIDEVKFLNIIKNTFNLKNFDSTHQSMKLFSDFWKLSNEYYNEMIFFKNGECIFKMIDCLDDDNPLLRHLSKSWLNQAYQQFHKILDPIYNILLNNTISIINKDQISIDKEYNTLEIRKSFRRLKNIILNTPVMDFLTKTKIGKGIISLNNLNELCLTDNTYLGLLVGLTLRFTQGKCVDSLSREFKGENYSVNASSCEFLEFILNKIKDKNLLMKFAILINEPIVTLLDKAIEDNDEVMQVQLLSVLRVIYFNSSNVHLKSQANKTNVLSLFQNENLHKCLIKGMTSDYFYVRENFIKFTVSCLPYFSKVMNDISGLKKIYNIGANYIFSLIKNVGRRIEIEKKGRKDTEKFSLFDIKNSDIVFKNYLDEYKEYKRYDENDILMLLTGIRDILFQFMSNDAGIIKEDNKKKNKNAKLEYWAIFKKLLIENKKSTSGINNFFNNMSVDETDIKDDKDGEISVMPKNLFNGLIYNLIDCLLLTWINQSDKYQDYDYCLNLNGILPLKEKSKLGSLSQNDIKKNMKKINKNPIKHIVKEIAINIFKENPIDFIETLINLWCFNSKKFQNKKEPNLIIDKQYKLSIIELLISLKIPLNIILFSMGKIIQKKLNSVSKDKRYIKIKEIKCYITPYEFSVYEAKFFHFIYSYILLNPNLDIQGIIYNNNSTNTEKYESWKEMINLLNIVISDTKIIYTTCWIYEVLQLTLNKLPIKSVKDNLELKKSLTDIFNNVTNKIMEASFSFKTDSKYIKPKKLVIPFLPHVYYNIIDELYKSDNLYKKISSGQQIQDENDNNENVNLFDEFNHKDNNNSETPLLTEGKGKKNMDDMDNVLKGAKGKVNDFYRVYLSTGKVCSEYLDENIVVYHNPALLNHIYVKLSLITLKENFYKIFQGIFYDNQNSMKKLLMEIIKGIFELIKLYRHENSEDLFFAEFSTDFLVSLMKDMPEFLIKFGKDIFITYLNDPTFFVTTPKMLRNWRKILSISVKFYPELLSDLMKTMDGGYFSSGASDEDKIKTLRRISFIIYSCEKDTFAKEFEVIKSKVRDLLGSDNKNSKLKDEIFLMMRILFLRFSHEGVMKMIKDLWPNIFMELIQNIEDKNRNKDLDLVIESFKFIELLSLANVEEFCLYQWSFILDTYDMNYLDSRNEKSFLNILLDSNHKRIFKPITLKFLYKAKMFEKIDDDMLQINNKGKSELYICPKKNNQQEFLEEVRKFFYSIGSMNSYKMPVNYEQIENIIENDFLDIKDIKNKNPK